MTLAQRLLTALAAAVALACLAPVAPALAFRPLFDTWIGYDTGVYPEGRYPYAVATGDFDRDGDADLAVSTWIWTPGFAVLPNLGNGTYGRPVRYTSAEPALDVAAADFDRDGDDDVVVSNTGDLWMGTTVSLFRNLGGGSFAPQVQFAAGSGPVGLAVADFDGDQDLDLAVADYGYLGQGTTVSLLRNNGAGVRPAGGLRRRAEPLQARRR